MGKMYDWVENVIKGRIAETLVEELFLTLKYDVFRYGMENTVPGTRGMFNKHSSVSTILRKMPDFVVCNKKTGNVFFLEVKYRASGIFTFKDLDCNADYPYTDVYVVLISKRHIKCATYEELKSGASITPESKNYLGYRNELCSDDDKKIVIDFCQYAVKFFESV